jgi:hypothetical protein
MGWRPVDQAIEALKAMGVRTLIYTSPSHTAVKPKWRLHIPLSKLTTGKVDAPEVSSGQQLFQTIF